MEDDIDIEEHDLLNNPALGGVFPDLTILKSEIVDFNISTETPTKTQVPERNENQLDGTLASNSGSLLPVCTTHDIDVKPDIICIGIDAQGYNRDSSDIAKKRRLATLSDSEDTDVKPNLLCTDIDDTKTLVSNNLSESDRIVHQVYSNRIKLNSGIDVNSILELDYNNIKKEDICYDTEPDAVITINSYGENSRRITILEKYLQVNVVLTDCYTSLLNNNCYCAQCAVLFPTTEAYSEHYTSTHTKTTNLTKVSASLVTCNQIIYTCEKSFVCDTCKKTYNNKSHLKRHMLVHTGKRPFQCDLCSKTYNQSNHLKTHKLLHTGEKPFKCETCKKTFDRISNLKIHMLTHSGKKPFECETCKKKFMRMNYLKMHRSLHTREKAFECGTCKKTFRHYTTLKRHKLIHTGEKPFQCDICKKLFNQRSALNRHKILHTAAQRYDSEGVRQQCEIRET
ncbi:unnamed protein product [Plutella xylostella]|uniref:Protein hunchback n=1 Tax=Plutella xylostella TaxID=51655 RepID=A0A8S4EW52_PLUXY|nr:unnamed protein product [Plutella xylostella]